MSTTPMQAGISSLHHASGKVQQHHEDLVAELTALKGEVEAIASNWQGGAHSAFQNVMATIHEHGQKLTGTLHEMGQNIRQNANAYSSHDAEFTSQLNAAGNEQFSLGGTGFSA